MHHSDPQPSVTLSNTKTVQSRMSPHAHCALACACAYLTCKELYSVLKLTPFPEILPPSSVLLRSNRQLSKLLHNLHIHHSPNPRKSHTLHTLLPGSLPSLSTSYSSCAHSRRGGPNQGPKREPRGATLPAAAGAGGLAVHLRRCLRPLCGDCDAPPRLLRAPALHRLCNPSTEEEAD